MMNKAGITAGFTDMKKYPGMVAVFDKKLVTGGRSI
jgi:hypothetical protein